MTSPRTLVRANGAVVDYAMAGPESGDLLVLIHGTPGCLQTSAKTIETAAAQGLRTLTFSRPGYGGSSPQPGRSVADVAALVSELLAAVDVETTYVAGWSGGGPHALACGALLGEQVKGVAVIAGVAPYTGTDAMASDDWFAGMGQDNLDEFGAALAGDDALAEFLAPVRESLLTATGADIVPQLESLLPQVDRDFISGDFGDELAADFREALRVSAAGWHDDDRAFTRHWGFDLADIAVPVSIWQGDLDLMVPIDHGRHLISRMPSARAHLLTGEGHISLARGRFNAIVADLIA